MCFSDDKTDDEIQSTRRVRPRDHTSARPSTGASSASRPIPALDPQNLDESFFINNEDFPDTQGLSNPMSETDEPPVKALKDFLPDERHPLRQHERLQTTPGTSSLQTHHTSRSGRTLTIETTGSYETDQGQTTFNREDSIRREKDYTRLERRLETAWIDRGLFGGKGKMSQNRYHSTDIANGDRKVEHWKGSGHVETSSEDMDERYRAFSPKGFLSPPCLDM